MLLVNSTAQTFKLTPTGSDASTECFVAIQTDRKILSFREYGNATIILNVK